MKKHLLNAFAGILTLCLIYYIFPGFIGSDGKSLTYLKDFIAVVGAIGGWVCFWFFAITFTQWSMLGKLFARASWKKVRIDLIRLNIWLIILIFPFSIICGFVMGALLGLDYDCHRCSSESVILPWLFISFLVSCLYVIPTQNYVLRKLSLKESRSRRFVIIVNIFAVFLMFLSMSIIML